jgi:RNA recognition motif-containing protein
VHRDRETGISSGFGFVTFAEPTSARTAIQRLNGLLLPGAAAVGLRPLKVGQGAFFCVRILNTSC